MVMISAGGTRDLSHLSPSIDYISICWYYPTIMDKLATAMVVFIKEDFKMANDGQVLVEILQGTHAVTGGG
jgi:hypothetical protein